MRDFYQFLAEDIVDPKRNPKKRASERIPSDDPADDDYDPQAIDDIEAWADDDDHPHGSSKLGLSAAYPLAQASGKMRGFQVGTPKQILGKRDSLDDNLSPRDLLQTLVNKSRTGERMSSREIDALIRLLNKQDARLKAQYQAGKSRLSGMLGQS